MKQPIYRYECELDEVIWRGPADDEHCWHCGQPGRQVCLVAEMVWTGAAA